MKFIVLLVAVLIGLTSGLTFKQQLLSQISSFEANLRAAITESETHGLIFYKPVFQSLLKELSDAQRSISLLKDSVQEPEIKVQVESLTALRKRIKERIADPVPIETLKIRALNHAASKENQPNHNDHETAKMILSGVIALVGQENRGFQVPGLMDGIIDDLEHQLSGWSLYSFPDNFGMSRETSQKVIEYRERSWNVEADELAETLAKFDNVTLDMAHLIPLKTQHAVESFFKLSKDQNRYMVDIIQSKPSGKSSRDSMLSTLDALENRLKTKVEHLKDRALAFYVARLESCFTAIENKRAELLKYPAFDATKGQEYLTNRYLISFVSDVDYRIAHPADEESFKSGVLYLAAKISLKNQTGSTSKITPKFIQDEIKKMIVKEDALANAGDSLNQKADKISSNEELQHDRKALSDLLKTEYELPYPGSHEKLEEDVKEKMRQLREKNPKDAEAAKQEKDLVDYVNLTRKLDALIPIDNDHKVEQWFVNARVHHAQSEKFEQFVAEKVHY